MKVFSKRNQDCPDPLVDAKILLSTINSLRKYALVPKGLYRFNSHAEADEWMMKNMVNTHALLKSNDRGVSFFQRTKC